jgi:DNA-directed RNA polymerase subunit RPC12/RpoP
MFLGANGAVDSDQEKTMQPLDRDTAKKLFQRFRTKRDGIRNSTEMASVCLICGSIHIIAKPGDDQKLMCRDCGFPFYRYSCSACGKTVDGRDPMNPMCRECGLRVCTCGACGCHSSNSQTSKKEQTNDSGK